MIQLRVKAVPNSSRDAIAGMLGDRIKIKVAAPPEEGKANKAIRTLLARRLALRPAQVAIAAGHTGAEKIASVEGVTPDQLSERLGLDASAAIAGTGG